MTTETTETMPIDQYNNAKEALLTSFNRLAPNGRVQAAMVRIVHEMERDHCSYSAVLSTIANATTDGLDYDNWPTIPDSEKE